MRDKRGAPGPTGIALRMAAQALWYAQARYPAPKDRMGIWKQPI
ncbi:MAG: hypothetical protein ABIT64_05615 [Lysobacteraceae bacterium]